MLNNMKVKRTLAMLIAMVMVFSLLPLSAFAADPVRLEDNDPSVVWTAGWKVWGNSVHYRETNRNATPEEAFDTVTVPFNGTGIEIIGKKASNGNILLAAIDGKEMPSVDFYGDQGQGGEQLVARFEGLKKGDHTLVLTNTNTHNPNASPLGNDAEHMNFQPEINYFMILNEEQPVDPEPQPEENKNFADGAIHDEWHQDPQTVKGEPVCAVEDGKLHLKAGVGNGNGSSYNDAPAIFLNDTASAALKAAPQGETRFLQFTMVSLTPAGQSRFGVLLNFEGPGKTFVVAEDAGGWFWERKGSTADTWYQQGRKPAPQPNQEYVIRLEWNDTALTKATVNGENMFPGEVPFAGLNGGAENKDRIAMRCSAYKKSDDQYEITDVLISNVTYSGQAVMPGYNVSGKVLLPDGSPAEGAAVTLNGAQVAAGSDGTYLFTGDQAVPRGTYTLRAELPGYAPVTREITVQDGELQVEEIRLTELPTLTGFVRDAEGSPIQGALVQLTVNGQVKTGVTDEQGAYTILGVPAGTHKIRASADFFYTSSQEELVTGEEDSAKDLVLAPMETAVLSTEQMDVTIYTKFPLAMKYDMKGTLEGKTFLGQTQVANQVLLNGRNWVVPENVVFTRLSDQKATYELTFKLDTGLHVVVYTLMEVKGNVLTFTITGVKYPEGNRLEQPLEQIYFYNQSLVSVRSTQNNAKVAMATLAPSTIQKGDTYAMVDDSLNLKTFNNMATRYAFVSNDTLSAGVFSNSDVGNAGAGSDNNRLMTNAFDNGVCKTLGISSNQWYYDRKISSSDRIGAANVDHVLKPEQKVIGIRPGRDEQPSVKVVITGECNGDNYVDWQDAAVAARKAGAVHIPAHSDALPDAVTTRIAMNFESEATNPFLTTLDNVKRVALHSDGLGQSVLLKGYASEGHDSGHPDYYDIGQRMGGVEDFNTMLHEGHKYGAQFGIHINCSEFYPEADAFSEITARWDGTGDGKTLHYGWNWLDQGVAMNGVYDLATDGRYNRLDRLHELVGDSSTDGLDYIYVDVWGNWTSGGEEAWQTRKLSNDITAGNHNWRIVHEWAWANDWDSTFQHWVSDFTYGNYQEKGKLNSSIIRFLLNGDKDSFPPDFPTYGGGSNAPLLGGCPMQGFEGWQSDYEYNLFIDTLYNQMIPTKFLQHFDVMQWKENDEMIFLPHAQGAGGNAWGLKTSWRPDVQAVLKDKDDNTVVVTRGSDGIINDTYSYGFDADRNMWLMDEAAKAERVEYRSRYITLNGKTILVGAANPGDFRVDNSVAGNLKYLIPWNWNHQSEPVAEEDEKLYHYNILGGESTWELPDNWAALSTVVVYKLTDQGRTEKQDVPVVEGKVTLTAEPGIPYVVLRGEAGGNAPQVTWTAPGQHLTDVSFNGALAQAWTVEGNAQVVKTRCQVPMLKFAGIGSVSQELKELTANTQYAVYVGVDNRSDSKASIRILDSKGEVVASNYSLRSFAINAVGSSVHQQNHNTEGTNSFFQNMYVFFTPAENETYTVVLSHEGQNGNAYFDDIRVVENPSDNYTFDAEGKLLTFKQDFENVAQGMFPFVVNNGGGVTDSRMHLAKKHAPYTQAGWDVKKGDDVLNGNWSLKLNGQVQRNGLMYWTIPQNIHFEPNVTYDVSFKYQMGSPGVYEVVYGHGTQITGRVPLEYSLGKTATAAFVMNGAEDGQSWIGIWSTTQAPDNQGTRDSVADFGGYKDFVLDDLLVQKSSVQKGTLSVLVAECSKMIQADYEGNWAAFEAALQSAREVLDNTGASAQDVKTAEDALLAARNALRKYETSLTVTAVPGAVVTLEDGNYMPLATAAADEKGVAVFEDLSAVRYWIRVAAEGYEVTSVSVTPETDSANPITVELTARTGNSYVNTFDTGADTIISLPGNSGNGTNEVIAVENGALKVTYNAPSADRNTIADSAFKMHDGIYEMDVTPLSRGVRSGISLISVNMGQRLFVGHFDSPNAYGAEADHWTNEYAGPGLAPNVTRTIKASIQNNILNLWVDGIQVMKNLNLGSYSIHVPEEAGYIGFTSYNKVGASFIFDNFRMTPFDEKAAIAAQIAGLIQTIGQVDLNDVPTLLQIEALNAQITDTERALIGNWSVYEEAAGQKDALLAKAVDDQIAALGEVTLDSEEAIQAARQAYNDLTEAQQALVTKLAELEAAEADLWALKEAAALEAVQAAKKDVLVQDAAPEEVQSGKKFVSVAADQALTEAVETAQSAIAAAATTEEVNAALKTLDAALAQYEAAVQTGTKIEAYRIENTDPEVTSDDGAGGPWPTWYDLSYLPMEPGSSGQSFTVTFTGTSLELVGQMATNGPIMTVTVDGKVVGEADFYGGAAVATIGKVWSISGLENTTHTVVFTFEGKANEAAAPNAGNYQAAFDYFDVNTVQPKPDTSALTEAIAAAKAAKEGITVSDETADKVEKGTQFVSNAVDTALTKAIAAAETALETVTSAEEVTAAVEALNTAAETYKAAVQTGTYDAQAEADKAAAKAVDDQIAALGEVTLDSEEAIAAARKAYNDLTEAQKKLVKNLATLEAAEAKLQELKDEAAAQAEADKKAAKAVDDQIAALGEVTLDSEEAIAAARKAYDELTKEQKELVKNLAALEAAEAKLQELKNEAAAAEALKAAKAAAKDELDKAAGNPRHQAQCDAIRAQYKEAIDKAKTPEEVRTLLASAKAQLAQAAICPSEKFKDVKANGWYHEAVDYAIEQGLMKGVSDDRFSIDGTLTRGQLVTILYRAEGSPSIKGMKNPFEDIVVNEKNWYAEAVIWAYNNGIVKGVTDVKFAPMNKITREQLVSILFRYNGSKTVEGDLKAFVDADKVSAYAREAMVWGVANNIVSGIPSGEQVLLKPQGNATRAQAAAIMMRFDGLNKK